MHRHTHLLHYYLVYLITLTLSVFLSVETWKRMKHKAVIHFNDFYSAQRFVKTYMA